MKSSVQGNGIALAAAQQSEEVKAVATSRIASAAMDLAGGLAAPGGDNGFGLHFTLAFGL